MTERAFSAEGRFRKFVNAIARWSERARVDVNKHESTILKPDKFSRLRGALGALGTSIPLVSMSVSAPLLSALLSVGVWGEARAAQPLVLKGLIVTSEDPSEGAAHGGQAGPGAQPAAARRICGKPIEAVAMAKPLTASDRASRLAQDPIVVQLPEGLLNAQALRSASQAQLGKPIDNALTQVLVEQTIQQLNESSRYLADVYFPPQSSPDGVLTLVVRPARLGRVIAQGQQHVDGAELECRVHLQAGEPVDVKAIATDVAYLNQSSPWRRTDLSFQPGQAPGTTDVLLTTTDERALRVYAGTDNPGTHATGLERYRVGVDWGNAFGLFDHKLGYSLSSAADYRHASTHALSYSLPVFEHDTLSLAADYSQSDVELQDGLFNSSGSNTDVSLRWSRSLGVGAPQPGPLGEVFAGVEYKRIGNALLFGQTPVSNSVPRVLQLFAGAHGGFSDPLGRNEFDARLTLSPGHLIDGNDNEHFEAARAGASSRYARVNASLDKYIDLPRQWQLKAHVHGQYADRALISSERIAVSGSSGVRGYYEDTLTADAAVIGTLELQSPYWPLQLGDKRAVWQLVGFVDGARSWSASPEQHTELGRTDTRFGLASHGLGLRMNLNPTVTLKLDVAQRHNGLPDAPSVLWHGSLLIAY